MADSDRRLVELLSVAYVKCDRDELERDLAAIVSDARSQGLSDDAIDGLLDSWAVQFPQRRGDWISADAALGDLRRLLLGPKSHFARLWRRMRQIAAGVLDHYVAVASLVAVLGGVFYGLAYARFYELLDITPEQAGLSPAQILSHSVVGGLALTVLVAMALFCLVIPAIPMQDDKAAHGERGTWRDVLLNIALTAGGVAALFAIAAVIDFPPSAAMGLALLPLLFLIFGSFRVGFDGLRPTLAPDLLRIELERYLVVLVAFAIPVGLLVTGWATFDEATRLGRRASVGKAVRDPKIVGFPFLGVRAEPALITWRTGRPVSEVPRCVLYLGSSNGDTILYDHRSSSTFHVPAGDIAIELRSEMSSCEAPSNIRIPSILRHKDGELLCKKGVWRPDDGSRFDYQWVLEGGTVDDDKNGPSWLLDERSFFAESVIYCRVTARTPLGVDAAVSKPIIVGG